MKTKHKYSTYALVFLGVVILISIIAASLTSDEVDELCSTDNKIIKRISGNWTCADDLTNGTGNNITENSIQCPTGEYLYNTTIDSTGDLTGVCRADQTGSSTNVTNNYTVNVSDQSYECIGGSSDYIYNVTWNNGIASYLCSDDDIGTDTWNTTTQIIEAASIYNDTTYINELVEGTHYNVTSENTSTGTKEGTYTSLNEYDGISFNVTEDNADLDIRLNFTNVTDFNQFHIRYMTATGENHDTNVYLWDYASSTWESYTILTHTDGTYVVTSTGVFDDTEHIQNEIVQMKLAETGVGTNHKWSFDWITLSSGITIPSTSETDPLSIHKDGTTQLTGNWNAGQYNITIGSIITLNHNSSINPTISAGWNSDNENSIMLRSNQSVDLTLGTGGYFNIYNNTNSFMIYMRTSDSEIYTRNYGKASLWYSAAQNVSTYYTSKLNTTDQRYNDTTQITTVQSNAASWNNLTGIANTSLTVSITNNLTFKNSTGSELAKIYITDTSSTVNFNTIIYGASSIVAGTILRSDGDIYTTGAGDDLWLGSSTQGSGLIRLYADGSAFITNLTTTSKVSINTTNQGSELTVSGDINASNNIYQNNNNVLGFYRMANGSFNTNLPYNHLGTNGTLEKTVLRSVIMIPQFTYCSDQALIYVMMTNETAVCTVGIYNVTTDHTNTTAPYYPGALLANYTFNYNTSGRNYVSFTTMKFEAGKVYHQVANCKATNVGSASGTTLMTVYTAGAYNIIGHADQAAGLYSNYDYTGYNVGSYTWNGTLPNPFPTGATKTYWATLLPIYRVRYDVTC